MTKTCLIIGGGAAGCAAAHLMSQESGWHVTLVEQAPFLGAGIRTEFLGGHPYTFGPRHFLTQNERTFEYLNAMLPLRRCNNHEFWTYVQKDEQFYNFPIHEDDIERMPDRDQIKSDLSLLEFGRIAEMAKPTDLKEFWLQSVGPMLYSKFIDTYSRKMWGVEAYELDTFNWSPKGVALKSGPRAAWDTAISAYPYAKDGYNGWLTQCVQEVNVYLNTVIRSYNLAENAVYVHPNGWDGTWQKYDIIICTISPDIPFNFSFGKLPYIGRDLHKFVLPTEFALPENVFWIYNADNEPWTRITEMKKLTGHVAPSTLLTMEIPSKNGRHYPLPIKKHQRKAAKYHDLAGSGVYFMGRNGSYRYSIDIAACIDQAFELVQVIKDGSQDRGVVGAKWREI